MDMDSAKVAVLIGMGVFREFFDELYQHEAFPRKVAFNKDGLNLHVTVIIDKPDLLTAGPVHEIFPFLAIIGSLELRPLNDPEAAPMVVPLDIKVKLAFRLRDKLQAAPVLTIAYDGVFGTPSAPISANDVDTLFQQPSVSEVLETVEIDVLGPLTEGVKDIFFSGENDVPPSPNQWPVALRILHADQRTGESCLGLFLALPGDNPNPEFINSPMPLKTGLGIIYSRDFLDFVLAEASHERIGESIKGAKVTRMAMHMLDDAIHINGRLEKDNAKINLQGPIQIALVRGTTRLATGTRDVSVDVDLPWYAEALPWLTKILFFIPVFNFANIWLTPMEWEIEDEVSGAPQTVRRGLAGSLGASLQQLAEGLRVDEGIGSVTMDGTPDHSLVQNGNLLLFAQTFVSPLKSPIVKANYSRYYRHFIRYTLEDGRKFRSTELARLVSKGKVITPGFHEVKGRYMRANPDNETGNNLLEKFT